MSPTDKPLSAVLNLAIGEYAISKLRSPQSKEGNDFSYLELESIYGSNLEDLRKKLHEHIDYHLNCYIDFLHGN